MDAVRFGRQVRIARQRRGWRQTDLARRARCSPAAISRVERGQSGGLSVAALDCIALALGASLDVRLYLPGGELDRLLDSGHASLVDQAVALLAGMGWDVVPETSFSIFGERGSIDVLARHPASGRLVVVEVKTRLVDVQELLAGLDRKTRLAPTIARARGWPPGPVSTLLVVGDGRTNRRHVAEHAAVLDRALPLRARELRSRLAAPTGEPFAGILFLPVSRHATLRQRVRLRQNESGPRSTRMSG